MGGASCPTFAVDVLACPRCQGRMKLLGLVRNPAIMSRTLATVGEATEVPRRSAGGSGSVL